ncbi:hypothetical protein EYF80_058397 [Liparis tanakae]|uniref:Uncharacterized protein n=1 Tax=Liparis tanakae TaxID=230148 RepID=A0A4Z2ET31_9TELE|nr:hypothetical protein EYF80_058397 [Liparis tanakae]
MKIWVSVPAFCTSPVTTTAHQPASSSPEWPRRDPAAGRVSNDHLGGPRGVLLKELPPSPHLHFFDLPHVRAVGLEALQRVGLEAPPLVRQVQPQPLRLGVIGTDYDDVGPAGGAGVTLRSGADGEVVWDDCTGREQHAFVHTEQETVMCSDRDDGHSQEPTFTQEEVDLLRIHVDHLHLVQVPVGAHHAVIMADLDPEHLPQVNGFYGELIHLGRTSMVRKTLASVPPPYTSPVITDTSYVASSTSTSVNFKLPSRESFSVMMSEGTSSLTVSPSSSDLASQHSHGKMTSIFKGCVPGTRYLSLPEQTSDLHAVQMPARVDPAVVVADPDLFNDIAHVF